MNIMKAKKMHTIYFYPVGNGDCSQIILDNDKRILMDFRQHPNGIDKNKPEIDLSSILKEDLKNAKRDYFDVVVFTHADKDHIEGSTEFFQLDHTEKYQGSGRIKMNEVWVPATMVLESATNDEQSNEFVILRNELRHRLKKGSGIKVFSKPDDLVKLLEGYGHSESKIDKLTVGAGNLVDTFDIVADGVEFFCHSPYKKHSEDGEGKEIRNEAALIFNIKFKLNNLTYNLFAIGDTTADILADIVNMTEKKERYDRLDWNLFNIPHHCSYKALTNEDKGKTKTKPIKEVEALLAYGKKDSYMVSSSRPIGNSKADYEQTQPPHVQAKNTYKDHLEKINGRKFLVTMEESNINKPKPIKFTISKNGFSRAVAIGSAPIIGASTTPPRAG